MVLKCMSSERLTWCRFGGVLGEICRDRKCPREDGCGRRWRLAFCGWLDGIINEFREWLLSF